MSHMKRMQSERQSLMQLCRSRLKRVRLLLTVFVSAVILLTISCATRAPVLKPSPCPQWSEYAIDDLVMLLELQEAGRLDIVSLEYQLGENQRHCEALDAFLEDE